ncbi:MAG: hypothetical protein ABH842_06270 [Candidatus Micrarchaeota archaeon]
MYKFVIIILTFTFFSGCCDLTTPDSYDSFDYQSTNYSNTYDNSYPSTQNGATTSVSSVQQLPEVVVNGKTLSLEEIQELVNYYGIFYEGRFWYDPISGLAGREGYPAEFRLYPGHTFLGEIDQDASNGDTGVIVNDRELTEVEIQYLESVLQMQRQPGYYYLDSQGNFGNNIYGYVNLYSVGSGGYYDNNGQYQGTGEVWSTSGGYGGNSQGGCSYVNVGGDFATSGCG